MSVCLPLRLCVTANGSVHREEVPERSGRRFIEALRRTPSSKIRATDMELARYLLKWPAEMLFPVIDLLRFFLLHPFSNEMSHRSPFCPVSINEKVNTNLGKKQRITSDPESIKSIK